MECPARPTLWLDTRRSGLLPCSGEPADGLHIDCLRVAAWTTVDHGGSSSIELGSGARRGGLLGRLRRSGRSSSDMNELLAGIGGVTGIAVVPSDADNALGVVAEARRLGMLERLWITSADLAVLQMVRGDSPATRLLHTCDPAVQPRGAERHAAALRECEIEGVMVPADRASAGLVALMHRFGRIVGVDGAEYARMVRAAHTAGADIVCGPSTEVLREGVY